MNIGLVKKNSSSPFRLQRSIASQGGEGGAYESGGYDPNNVYNDNTLADTVSAIGNVVGAALSSRTSADINKSDVKKQVRQENRSNKIERKIEASNKLGDTSKASRLESRNKRVKSRLSETTSRINKYEESQNPKLESSILDTRPTKKSEPKVVDLSSEKEKRSLLGWDKIKNNWKVGETKLFNLS